MYKGSFFMRRILAIILLTVVLLPLAGQTRSREQLALYADQRGSVRMSSVVSVVISRFREVGALAEATGDEKSLLELEQEFIEDVLISIEGLTDTESNERIFTKLEYSQLPVDGVYFELNIYSLLQPGVEYNPGEMPISAYLSVIHQGKSESLTILKYQTSANRLAYGIKNAFLDYSVIFESDRPSVRNLYVLDRVTQLASLGF